MIVFLHVSCHDAVTCRGGEESVLPLESIELYRPGKDIGKTLDLCPDIPSMPQDASICLKSWEESQEEIGASALGLSCRPLEAEGAC